MEQLFSSSWLVKYNKKCCQSICYSMIGIQSTLYIKKLTSHMCIYCAKPTYWQIQFPVLQPDDTNRNWNSHIFFVYNHIIICKYSRVSLSRHQISRLPEEEKKITNASVVGCHIWDAYWTFSINRFNFYVNSLLSVHTTKKKKKKQYWSSSCFKCSNNF